MDLNKSKMKNIKAQLEPEPNFPLVATPNSSEWIIYIISYAYNPFTAPLGVTKIQYNTNKQNKVIFYKKWQKCNEIQLTKNKMNLNNLKMKNHPPSPDYW